MQYFSLKVVCEDYDAIRSDQTYVVGMLFAPAVCFQAFNHVLVAWFAECGHANTKALFLNLVVLSGLEPHSALPTALPMMFNKYCQALPKALQDIKVLATSTVSTLMSCSLMSHWLPVND